MHKKCKKEKELEHTGKCDQWGTRNWRLQLSRGVELCIICWNMASHKNALIDNLQDVLFHILEYRTQNKQQKGFFFKAKKFNIENVSVKEYIPWQEKSIFCKYFFFFFVWIYSLFYVCYLNHLIISTEWASFPSLNSEVQISIKIK